MTDITELAQSLKAAAEKWQEAWGKYDKVEITIAEFIRAANQYESIVKDPANVIELVEALEKAQGMEAYWKTQCRGITDHCEELQARIAELESRTVKLPDLRQIVSGDRYVWSDGVYNYSQDVKVALAAAGIKVEAD
nr:hypothetical protein [Klebsiella quasipneumoniae]